MHKLTGRPCKPSKCIRAFCIASFSCFISSWVIRYHQTITIINQHCWICWPLFLSYRQYMYISRLMLTHNDQNIAAATTTTTTIVLCPWYRSTYVSRDPQLRSGGLCMSKVLLSICPCWWKLVHSNQWGDTRVIVLNGVNYNCLCTITLQHMQ